MKLDNLHLDFDNAAIIQNDERIDSQGNKIVRQKLDNGVTWIRTETPDGYKRIDFSHQPIDLGGGSYKIDATTKKADFHDYY
ncbi:hypothetical protein [Enterococcus olivae]